ncbi:multidrug ABC transporter ATP-binding protein [Enemella dayhoffiae]|uniref:Multidrug ABC transporter ATP-binding protein n=1 Tax=Enemella dayhoffiae TaxID=2016507 RepID=A0A255H5W1_9ACTN|nr:ABC transporter ATP-binding protein [Enemella dayhoffiae]OYO22706.1 multidrug ABC transporter ATP-binding protein [Enemella dayhoffiae]
MNDAAPACAVSTSRLSKVFGKQTAVDSIDLTVPEGAVYGFLGPNGSGKTTTIRMLLGLVRPSGGEARVLGERVLPGRSGVLDRVGTLVEGPAFHPHLSGRANLIRLDSADLQADPATTSRRVDAALERVGLGPAAQKRYRAYSLGMRQRLGLAGALLRPRKLMVLDEPTNGLDPQGTREVRTLLAEVNAEGTTVLVSSHLLSEVEQVCSHVGMMRAGQLVAQGTLAEVRAGARPRARVVTADSDAAAGTLNALGLGGVRTDGLKVEGELPDATAPEAVVAALVEAGVGVREFTVDRPSLEDLFIAQTGEGFDVSG